MDTFGGNTGTPVPQDPVMAIGNNGGGGFTGTIGTAPSSTSTNTSGGNTGVYYTPNGTAVSGNQMYGYLAPAPLPPVDSTMDAGGIQQNQTSGGVQFPTNAPNGAQTASSANSANASIPSTSSIINQETQQTPAEQKNASYLGSVADFVKNRLSLATQQTNQEASAGVPGLTKTVNDLSAQLNGLNNQATALALEGGEYGTIQNQERLAERSGEDIYAIQHGRVATKDQLLQNQIKQSAIATQSLTTKSALYAAQGNLSLAKDAADKAAQVAFDHDQQQLDYYNALIDQNKPQMTKEENAQADLVKAQLADRQIQVNNQQDNFKAGQGFAITALTNNPNDPKAQFAAQQALKLDPKDPQYLQKVMQLVGQYQKDPVATAQAIAQLQLTQAQTRKAIADANASAGGGITLDKSGNLTVGGVPLAQYQANTSTGRSYIDSSQISDKKEATAVESAARISGTPVLNKDQADQINNIEVARNNSDKILAAATFLPSNAFTRLAVGPENTLSQFFQTNSDIAAFNSYRSAAIEAMRAMAGSKGLRINSAEIKLAQENDIPTITDTIGTANQKVANLKAQLASWEDVLIPPQQTQASAGGKTGTLSNGTVVTQNADGSITDAKGNKYDQNGNRI